MADEFLVLTRERLEPAIGQADAEQPLEILRHVDLEPAITRQDVQPPAEVTFAFDDLAQALAAIGHEHPPTLEVGREQSGNEVWSARSE